MTRSIRFLMRSALPNLAAAWAIGIGLFALNWLMGGPDSFVDTYYSSFPMMCLMFPLVCFMSNSSSLAQIALSMGETRRAYTWAVLGMVPLYAASYGIAAWVVASLPRWLELGWDEGVRFLTPQTLPMFLVSILCASAFSPLLGLALTRSRALGTVLISVTSMVLMGGMVFLMVIGEIGSLHLWGDLPAILMGAMGVLTVVSLVAVWKLMRTMIVR